MTPSTRCTLALAALLTAALPAPAMAQRATITLSPKIVTFPSSDPDTVPLVIAAPVQVTYQVQGGGKNVTWSLTVLAGGDLLSGGSSVDISNVTWIATPAPPFQNGTLSRSVAQVVASGSGQVNPARNGSITFRLANSWLYNAGTYTQSVTFTLSVP